MDDQQRPLQNCAGDRIICADSCLFQHAHEHSALATFHVVDAPIHLPERRQQGLDACHFAKENLGDAHQGGSGAVASALGGLNVQVVWKGRGLHEKRIQLKVRHNAEAHKMVADGLRDGHIVAPLVVLGKATRLIPEAVVAPTSCKCRTRC